MGHGDAPGSDAPGQPLRPGHTLFANYRDVHLHPPARVELNGSAWDVLGTAPVLFSDVNLLRSCAGVTASLHVRNRPGTATDAGGVSGMPWTSWTTRAPAECGREPQ